MGIRNIVKEGDEILRKKCRKVEKFDEKLAALLDDMAETMYEANGCGLAGPQVGILRQIVVIDTGDGLIELINPEIVERKGEQQETEGCLSLPGQWGVTKRPMWVKVVAQDRNGDWYEYEGEELLARAFCHEIDHLSGILFTDNVRYMVDPEEMKDDEE